MSKRILEKDAEPVKARPAARYLYVRFCENDGPDGVTRTILSFADPAVGARVHKLLAAMFVLGDTDGISDVLHNFQFQITDRSYEDEPNTKIRALLDSVGPECFEQGRCDDTGGDEFGHIRDGFFYIVQG